MDKYVECCDVPVPMADSASVFFGVVSGSEAVSEFFARANSVFPLIADPNFYSYAQV